MAVQTQSGNGVSVENQNISVDGEVNILGIDTALVQQTPSDITADDTYEVGETISFTAESNLTTEENRVEHVVALWNESAVADEELTIIAPDEITADTTTGDFTVNHTIAEVSGVQNANDDVSAFGRTLSSNQRAGVFDLADVVTFLANGGNFSAPETNRVGDTVINASMTSVNTTSPNTTIEVETRESFEPGEYVAVHMAMADGRLTKISSDREDITLTAQGSQPAFSVNISDDVDATAARGNDVEVPVTIENTGAAGADEITLSAGGDTLASRNVTLDANETSLEVFSVPTGDLEVGETTFTVASGENTDTVAVTLQEPSNFSVSVDLDASDNQYDPRTDSLNGTVNVTNTGGVSDEQNVSVSLGDETLVDRAVSLNGSKSTSDRFNRTLTAADAGDVSVTATTDDDITTETISILQPGTFEVNVIDSESVLSVVPGQNITVVAEVENVGETKVNRTVTLTNITADSSEVTFEEIKLGAGENQDFEAVVETNKTDAGSTRTYEVAAGDDDTDTLTTDVGDISPYLDVTIDGLNDSSVDEPVVGDTVPVRIDTTVENLGTEKTNGTVTFTANGDEFATKTFDGDTGLEPFNATYDVELGDAPEVAIESTAERDGATEPDSNDETTLDVTPNAAFEVTINETSNESTLASQEFSPTISVQNVGIQSGSGNISVFFNGTQQTVESFDGLHPTNGSRTIIDPDDDFTINASDYESNQTYLIETSVANDATNVNDDSDTGRVTIGDVANYTVTSVSVTNSEGTPVTVNQGEQITVEANITNNGDVQAPKPVTIGFGGTTLGTTDLNISGGDSEPISFTYTTTSAVAGTTTDVTASTPDDEATTQVTVRENAEFTASLIIDDTAIAGDTVTAAVTARNVGGLANNETDIRLLTDGQEVANTTNIQLSSGEQRTETYELSPETAGELEVQGVTDDNVATRTVTVGEPGALELNIRSITDPVTTAENITATVSAENIGDGDLKDRRVRLTLDGSVVATKRVSLESGEQRPIDFTTNKKLEAGNATVAAVAPEDRVEREIAIVEPAEPPYFRVDGLEASSEEVLNTDSETVIVNATITNVGETGGTQNITFSAGDAVTTTNDSLTVANGSAKEVSFEFNVSKLGLELDIDQSANVTYDITTANQSEAGTLRVTEPQPATPAFSSVAVPDDATQDESLTVSATVRNIGDEPLDASEAVTLAYDDGTAMDTVALNSSDTLAPGAEATVELSVAPPPEPLAGSFNRDVTVAFENYSSPVTDSVAVDFEGIASGVDAADSGDTVTVQPGEYTVRNTIEIPRRVTVQAASATAAPVIHEPSRSDGTALRVVGDGVTLDGLIFTGDGNGTAIEIASDATTLTDIRAQNWETGIDETAGTSTLTGVDITDTDVGIRLAGAGETVVEYPRVINAADTGILVESDANEIIGAEVLRSTTGIELLGAGNEVLDTTVRNSPGYGIRVTEVPGNLEKDPSAVINGGVLESNGVSVFSDGSEVDATGNWWGTLTPVANVDYTARSKIDTSGALQTRPNSDFTVTNSKLPRDVARGSTFTVEPTIENNGTASDLQRIELRRGDGTVVDSQSLSLDNGTSGTVTLSDSTDVTDGDAISLTVASLDDTNTTKNITVNDPAEFAFGDVSAKTTTLALGEPLSVDAQVDNVGDSPGTVTAELRDFDGDVVDTADVNVDASSNKTPTLLWDTDTEESGNVTVTLVDDSGSAPLVEKTLAVTVGPAAPTTLSVSVDGVSDSTLTVDETATVSATAGLTDDSNVNATASTSFSSNNTTVATVSENTITAEAVGTATIEGTYTDSSETVRNTVDVTVEAAADEADETEDSTPTNTGGGGGGGGGFFGSTPADSPNLDATASETVRPTIDATTNQRVATFEKVSNVQSIAFDTTDRIGEVTVSDVDPDTSEVNAPGGAVTVQEIVVPDDMTEQSASIRFRVSSERLETVGASADDLVAVRLTDDGWKALESTSVDETEEGVEIEATTPGFSVFAVSAVGQPEAAASATPSTVTAGETLELDGSDSTDQFGDLVRYDWSIDGQSLSGETASIMLDESGEYTAELTVTNDAGETDTATTTVTVEQAPDGGDGGADGGDGGVDGGDSGDGGDTDTSEDGIPGFGVVIALLAVIAAALLASRRTEQ